MSALGGASGVTDGRRDQPHHRLQRGSDSLAGLAARQHGLVGGDGEPFLDLVADPLGLGGGQVDLVDERDDREAGVHGQERVRDGLRLNALRRVDHQEHAFARGERSRDLVGEVDVPGGVDEIQLVALAVLGVVPHADGLRLDGDPALALDVHAVEHLLLHLALRHGVGELEDAVGQRRLAVVDVRDDREVANVIWGCRHGETG